MFGIGFPELVIIVLAVIIFLKPEDLPAFFRMAGRTYVKIKKALKELDAIKTDFMKVVDESAKEGEAKPTPTGPATYAAVQKAAADAPAGSGIPASGSAGSPDTRQASESPASSVQAGAKPESLAVPAPSPGQSAPPAASDGSVSDSGLPDPYAAAYQERISGASAGFDPETSSGRPSGPGSAGLPPRRTLSQSPDDLVDDIFQGPSSRPSGMGSAALPPRKDTPSES